MAQDMERALLQSDGDSIPGQVGEHTAGCHGMRVIKHG